MSDGAREAYAEWLKREQPYPYGRDPEKAWHTAWTQSAAAERARVVELEEIVRNVRDNLRADPHLNADPVVRMAVEFLTVVLDEEAAPTSG